MDLFGRRTRRENRELATGLTKARANLTAARQHREVVENERDMWQRRATEWANSTVTAEKRLRVLSRENADLRAQLHRQEQILHQLQDVNERHYAELADKAGAHPAPPVAAAA